MLLPLLLAVSLVNNVRTLIARHDLASAEREVRSYQATAGITPEFTAALSWLAREAVTEKKLDQADAYAGETRKFAMELLRTRKLDADPWLPVALGASIEVHAEVLAARGERSEAVSFLQQQLGTFGSTSIAERIHKNLNLLSLEGKPAPPLQTPEWVGTARISLADLRGHPVLIFFWAHWCPDCKSMAPMLAALMSTYGPKGLRIVAPTRLYGYIAGGEDAPPGIEKQYTERIRQQFYPMLASTPIPLSAANFLAYGASTTPTLVLIDAAGIVRYYHPGAATEAELTSRIRKILGS